VAEAVSLMRSGRRERGREREREKKRERNRQEGAMDKIPFKDMPPVTFFFQPGPISHDLPITPSNSEFINGSLH
jgi:hypothetical protein